MLSSSPGERNALSGACAPPCRIWIYVPGKQWRGVQNLSRNVGMQGVRNQCWAL
jgi:hypothetical protein